MMVPGKPGNAGGGYFGLMGRAFDYMPDKYVEQLPYGKREPYASWVPKPSFRDAEGSRVPEGSGSTYVSGM